MKFSILLFSFLNLSAGTALACSPVNLYPIDPMLTAHLNNIACEDVPEFREKVVDFDAENSKSGVAAKYVLRNTGANQYTILFKLNNYEPDTFFYDKVKMCLNRINSNAVDGKQVKFGILPAGHDRYDEIALDLKVEINRPCNIVLQHLMQNAGLQTESTQNPLLKIACSRPEGPDDSLMNENVQDENNNLQKRVLYPAHLRALIYPMCAKKNYSYYECAQPSITEALAFGEGCAKPDPCSDKRKWLK